MKIILNPELQPDPLKPKPQFVNATPPAPPAASALRDGFYCDVPGCKHATDPFLERDALLAHKAEAHRPPVAPPQRFYCNVPGCDKSGRPFDTALALQQHQSDKHPDLFPHKCPICGAGFRIGVLMAKHMQTAHTEEERTEVIKKREANNAFPCPHCFRRFEEERGLNSHISRTHKPPDASVKAEGRKFQCSLCAYSTDDRRTLSLHFGKSHPNQVTKVETDPFECGKCGQTFYSRGAIYPHWAERHGEERPIQCITRAVSTPAPPAAAPSAPPPVATAGKVASASAILTVEKDFAREAVGRLLDLGFTKLEVTIQEKL